VALLFGPTFATAAAAAIVPTLPPLTISHATEADARGTARIVLAADAATAAATVVAAFLAQATGDTRLHAVALEVAELIARAIAAATATAVVTTLLAIAVGHAILGAVAVVAVVLGRTGAATPAAPVVATLVAGTVRLALGITVSVGGAEEARRATAAGAPTAVAAAFFAHTVGLTLLLAVAGVTEEAGGATPTGPAAPVGPALLAVAIGDAAADALAVVAGLARLAVTAAAAAAVGAARLARALGLAGPLHTLAVLTTLVGGAGATTAPTAIAAAGLTATLGLARGAAAARLAFHFFDADVVPLGGATVVIQCADAGLDVGIAAAGGFLWCATIPRTGTLAAVLGTDFTVLAPLTLAITARGPPVTHSATQGGDFVDTDLIPFGLTTEGILLADACLRETIVTPGLRMGGAAARTRTGSAIVGAGEAALVLGALAIAAAATVTTAAAEFCHLFNADTIPGEFAAEGVLGTDAGLEGGVVAPRRILGLTTATGAPTRAAILGADLAILSRITTAVPALWPGTVATATPHALHFSGTDAIPFGLAAIGVVSADAAFHRGVVASRRAVVSAAVAIAAAPATVIRTRCAILVHRTDAVATGLAPATVSPIPGAGTVAVADVVVGPVTRVAGLAAGAGARIAGAEITASSALATAQVAHLVHADVVPLGFTAEGIVGTDAGGDGRIEASRRAVGRTTIAVTGTTAAILGAGTAAFVCITTTVAAESPA
jgi:hypothetical protein